MYASPRFALTLLTFAVIVSAACPHGHRGYWSGYHYPSYYYSAAPVWYDAPMRMIPAAPVMVCPGPQPPQVSIYAQPSPAPASAPNEPPQSSGTQEPPKVSEFRSNYSAYTGREQTSYKITASLCRVGYWNVTRRQVSLSIDGQSHTLPPGRGITLTVPRQFSWQTDNGKRHFESVPDNRPTLEIVIRR